MNVSDLEKKNRNLLEQLQSQQDMFIQTNNYLADIKKELELSLKEISILNAELENQVLERTKELDYANQELKTLLYRTSHDFRSPVASLKGLLNIIQPFSSDPTFNFAIQNSFEMIRRQENLFQNLRNIHLIKDGHSNNERTNFQELINKVLQKLSSSYLNIKQKTKIIYLENHEFKTDDSLIEIILFNILENAYIFSDGSEILVSLDCNNEEILLKVEDQGEGIPDAVHKNIYEMFFRGSVNSKGNGLGLYVAKTAVTKLKGTINCFPSENNGTIFEIKLPNKKTGI
ncbi:MAG: HAMP domain-containing histidine kinase [Opitutaceae bacterium]|nr:HAMP domain-containing histidine kinase [Cytophagales bacterium]